MKKLLFILLISFPLLTSASAVDSIDTKKYTLHLQSTLITQFKPGFHTKYDGENSFSKHEEAKTSFTSTLYAGIKTGKRGALFINPELAGGSGLSKVLGVGAAPNGETYRVGDPGIKIAIARCYYRYTIPLGDSSEIKESDQNIIPGKYPKHFFSFTLGKISIPDFFDKNRFSHNPRTQFMSWALMSNGAWDYPANTKGYTPSFILEYVSKNIEVRYGFSLVPLSANGNRMNWNFTEANSNTLEFSKSYLLFKQEGCIRLGGFYTIANMGSYAQSIALNTVSPDILMTRKKGRTKYGCLLNVEQKISAECGLFFRAGWNDGHNETWTFTEVDKSVSGGISLSGKAWKRKSDCLGLAYVASGISTPHKNYLRSGGKGFMLGDGKLSYDFEKLTEMYYSASFFSERFFLSGSFQTLLNPGYNSDRKGLVEIYSIRLHLAL